MEWRSFQNGEVVTVKVEMFPEGEVSSEVTGEVMTPAGGWRLLARAGDGSRDARLRPSTHQP